MNNPQVVVQIGPPGTGKTTQLGIRAAAAAETYGHEKVVVCSLSRTGARQAGKELELPFEQFATVHGFAYRALGSPELAEAHIDSWNAAYPHWALSGGKRTADDAYDIGGTEKPGDRLTGSPDFKKAWVDWKTQCHYLDFTDVLEHALTETTCIPGNPAVILVDETQDTPPKALQLIFHWAKAAQELVMAGDHAQSIFSFLGADALILQKLWKKYDPDRAPLPQSYRLPQTVYTYARQWQKRFTTTIQVDYAPTSEEGFVRPCHSLRQFTGNRVMSLLENNPGKNVMFLATCGYMLDGLVHELRSSGIPFYNPMRPNHGKWNPLPRSRKNSHTVVDNVLAFSRPSATLWGEEKARFWTAAELKGWASKMPAAGVFTKGSKKKIDALDDSASDEAIATAFFEWFTSEAIAHIVPCPDIPWFMAQVKGSEDLRNFVSQVIRAQGVPALQERPRVMVGTVHSLKGHEADIVVLCPDISPEGYTAARKDTQVAEELKRLFYVGLTRAKLGLYLCAPDSRTAVRW